MTARSFGSLASFGCALACASFLFACASMKGGGASEPAASQPAASQPAASQPASQQAPAAKPAAPAETPPPPGSKFAQIQVGMTDAQVRAILGEPSDAGAHITGKAFIPYYMGSDTSRIEWVYKGQGTIQFNSNRWTGAMKVTRVVYDPTEDGVR
jgi:hypothetical protein